MTKSNLSRLHRREGLVHAFSARGERLGEATYKLREGETSATVAFEVPLELRNQVARLEIPGERSAGAVSLIDASTQWHRVGLISGESREQSQPLLAPLYYIKRRFSPMPNWRFQKKPTSRCRWTHC